jgi:hypothetical protein
MFNVYKNQQSRQTGSRNLMGPITLPTIGEDLIFGHKLHIGTPYRGKRYWTHQIPTSCLPTLLIFIHMLSIKWVWFMVFNTTFNNISVISLRSVLLVEETEVPGENH